MNSKNRKIVLAAVPEGIPKESDFSLVETEMPRPGDGEFLVRINYLSVDPYMRGLIRGVPTYREPVRVGDDMVGDTVGTIVESRHPDYREGEVVAGYWGWREYAVSDGSENVRRFDTSLAPMSAAVGVLGMPGMTAYFGLLEIGEPREGETVFVSGAAGAVGSLVGQIAKIRGCRVVGSAGSQAKIDWLLNDLGFDAALNYKDYDCDALAKHLQDLYPDGVDVFFDNTGGHVCDAVFRRINVGARIVVCGQIDQYNATDKVVGPRLLWHLIVKRARAQGFLVFQFADRYAEGMRQMAEWLREGKIKYRETITDGLENAPAAFIGLFTGANTGKQVVRVSEE